MTPPRQIINLLLLVGFIPISKAAVISAPDLVSTLISVSSGSTLDKDPSPLVDSKDLINGSDRGDVISAASGMNLVIPQPDDFTVSAASLSSNTSRVNSGGPVVSSSLSRYEISFELLTGESGNIALQFSSTLQDLGVTSSINWSLSGPFGSVSGLSGTLNAISGLTIPQTGTTAQTAALTEGSYTFTIETVQPTLTLQNSKSGRAEIANFTLTYAKDTVIPEPASFLLSLISLPLLLRRRRSAEI